MPKNTNYQITTTLAVDGEKEFKAAMDAANKSMRVSDSELKKLKAAYDAGGTQMDYYTGRAKVMNREAEQQEAIVEALRKAVEQAGEKFGEASDKVKDYQIKLNNAEAKQIALAKAAQEANRELEELGRDSGKIGRQIERGIGDAAEDTREKLDSMFEHVQKDVNAIKSTVAFETSMNVGSFVLDGIQNIMGFVEENQEFNRRMAQTRTIVEMYGYNADEIINIAKYAGSIIGDFENAQEAIVNLAAAGFENEEQIKATVENLLGIWLSSAGTLDFSGLAEDYLESVNERTPTGTYAEAIIKFTDRSVEDVKKVLESMESHADTLEAATAILTEAGLQTKTKNFFAENEELVKAEAANIELSIEWAKLAAKIQPTVTGLIKGTTNLVAGLNATIDEIEKFKYSAKKQMETKTTGKELIQSAGITADDLKLDFIDKLVEWRKKLNDKLMVPVEKIEEWLLPSAGAETLNKNDPYEAGFKVMQQYNMGMQEAADAEVTAAQAAVATTIAQMQTEDQMEAAFEAGKNAMLAFGNGIAEGAAIPINNVRDMVNAINQTLSQIATPAYGLGWSGITGGNIYLYNQQRSNAKTVSKMIGRGVAAEMVKK